MYIAHLLYTTSRFLKTVHLIIHGKNCLVSSFSYFAEKVEQSKLNNGESTDSDLDSSHTVFKKFKSALENKLKTKLEGFPLGISKADNHFLSLQSK